MALIVMLVFLGLSRISSFSFNLLDNWMNIASVGVVVDLAAATDGMPFSAAIPLSCIMVIILLLLSRFFGSFVLIWTGALQLDRIMTTCSWRWPLIRGSLYIGGWCTALNLLHHLLLFVLDFHVFEVLPLCQYLHGLDVFNCSQLVSIVLVAAE